MVEPVTSGSGHQSGLDGDDSPKPESPEPQDRLPSDEPPKKRRRTAKPNADKKFECQWEGCGKSYSRAEHLYRHQLNHTPKTLYWCDFPGCTRHFVRQDLCVRHRERHTTQGSQLNRRDAMTRTNSSPQQLALMSPPLAATETRFDLPPPHDSEPPVSNSDYVSTDPTLEAPTSNSSSSIQRSFSATLLSRTNHTNSQFVSPTPRTSTTKSASLNQRNHSFEGTPLSPDHQQPASTWPRRQESLNQVMSNGPNGTFYSQSVPQSPVRTYSNSSISTPHPVPFRSNSDAYVNQSRDSNVLPGVDMLPIGYTNHVRQSGTPQHPSDSYLSQYPHSLAATHHDPFSYSNIQGGNQSMDMTNSYNYPVLGGDDYGRSPFMIGEDFNAWLFNQSVVEQTEFSPSIVSGIQSDHSNVQMQDQSSVQSPSMNYAHQNHISVHSGILDTSAQSSYIMSESKRKELLDLMSNQFIERPHDAVKRRKHLVFEGDVNSDGHILGLRMMHTYIGSYWYHQHAQLPILHKPTFSADRTPTLLLLAVIAIGAATLDKAYGTTLTDSAAEFSNFIVWHLRWEIIRDIDYRPPAKLWVLQTLLLVEVYEKMYSTRTLHERAHIHHDSTLTLLRRGSSLIGRSTSESASSIMEERNTRGSSGGTGSLDSADDSWNRWIATEASRRAVFGAFVLDSIHCTMFGHAAKMVTHEIRLPLPCDEALWSATSVAEIGRVQNSLRTNGIKPILFHEGLKSTLNGQRVRTNSFGRMAIMAGLLSLSWHMTQRDLQFAYIGRQAANSIGGADKWKSALLRAFDNWKKDFDEALAEAAIAQPLSPPALNGNPVQSMLRPIDDENIFETRTVLHHLAHIAAHIDIVDCQVFAGANRLLSRTVTPKDYSLVRDKIEKWALRASARDSAFYALKFITTVLIPPTAGDDGLDHRIHGHATPILPLAYDNSDRYIARDDFLLNRPWVLYVSALVVWCYGYALEGPIVPTPRDEDFATYEQKERDMRLFLDNVAAVRAPDDLEHVTGKNRCLGLLLILKESFASTRWELTHEAAGLLSNAAMKLRGSPEAEETMGRGSTGARGRGRASIGGNVNGVGGAGNGPDMMDYTSASVSAFNTARP